MGLLSSDYDYDDDYAYTSRCTHKFTCMAVTPYVGLAMCVGRARACSQGPLDGLAAIGGLTALRWLSLASNQLTVSRSAPGVLASRRTAFEGMAG